MGRVRLPLALGVDALWGIGRGFALLVPSALLGVNGVLLVARGDEGGVRLALGVVGFLAALALLFFAFRARASDAVLDADGIAIEGGRHGGTRLPWSAIASSRIHSGSSANSDHTLVLETRNGEKLVIAEAQREQEKASVAALGATIAARLGERSAPPPKAGLVPACVSCRAPLPPSELAEMHCPSCGASNPVAAEIRERVAAHRAVARADDPASIAVRHLVDQPGAVRASAALLAAGIVSAIAWVPVVGSFLLLGIPALGPFEIGLGLFNGWAFTFAAFAFARVALARRRALQVLTTTFAARKGANGAASECRVCGGPLPESASPIAGCAYCGAENVLGLDVRPLLAQAQGAAGSVAELLASQRRERGRFVGLAAGGAAAALVGGLWLVVQVAVAAEVAETRIACEKGDPTACADLARSYASGSVVEQDDAAASAYYGIACNLGHAEACRDVAVRFEMGWGAPRDPVQAANALARSCALGWAPACEEQRQKAP